MDRAPAAVRESRELRGRELRGREPWAERREAVHQPPGGAGL
ncbi:hypothetical protein [Streptomyces scabiei]|nr:hypothetical protein [Streptomyces scabiei]MDX3521227.1 hypothetical protein [Streptomyces scabiei]